MKNKIYKVGLVGLRHPHIYSLYNIMREHPNIEIVAVCEEDEKIYNEISAQGHISITHTNYLEMLDNIESDIIAIGDVYQKHGSLGIQALRYGKHVIFDKPVCMNYEELAEIESLIDKNHLAIGCMLDLRCSGNFIKIKEEVEAGTIGELITIAIFGRHPLNRHNRPEWYFEPDKHGGTINDIGIHAVDTIMWLTGEKSFEINAARQWNAKASDIPYFMDSAQFMLRSKCGVGVLSDISYLAPDGMGYLMDDYWQVICHGTKGMIKTSYTSDFVILALSNSNHIKKLIPAESKHGIYLSDFLKNIEGKQDSDVISTDSILKSTHLCLQMSSFSKSNNKNL